VEIKNCRVCGSSSLEIVFELRDVPLAGDFRTEIDQKNNFYPLVLLHCGNCFVLQLRDSVDMSDLFSNYFFSSSSVPNLVSHFRKFSKWIVDTYQPKKILEIGCNDGVLLEPLAELGVEVYGIDMSTNITRLANSKGLNVRVGKFATSEMGWIKEWVDEVDIVTVSNAFPHNDNPNDFLNAVSQILSKQGLLIIEFMYSGDLKTKLQWDSLYHEHIHIHSLKSIQHLLRSNDFFVLDVIQLPIHAGSLRVVASRRPLEPSNSVSELLAREETNGLNKLDSWLDFGLKSLESIETCISEFNKLKQGSRIWAYGASGRASMWLNACNMDFIEAIVDKSPLRNGKYMPGIPTQVVSVESLENAKPDYVFVTAWNYFTEIRSQHPKFTGNWIVPLPRFSIF